MNRPEISFPFVLHGGDYNPEQWSAEVWDEDVRLMNEAGVNIATLPVFGWGNIQKAEDEWDFSWLDTVIEKLHAGGIRLCLATATAATPPWLDQKYPDILRVERDGRRRKHGSRHSFCPNSANFRRLSVELARAMAERYGRHPALLIWHVSNEYGNHCYCELCSAAFRVWLQERYKTLDEVNQRWNMAFWGQTYTQWSQIEAPQDLAQRNFQGLLIDYDRFQSHCILESCKAEAAVLREFTPDVPVTTNLMGTFKPLDYHLWAKELDIVSWDSYPSRTAKPEHISFSHSLMRGLKAGQPWLLMEQTPSQQNWQAYNSLKRPGVMRLWSYQAMAHGSDAVMYFQWRRSQGAQEMFHGAVVEHAARPEARVFQEVAALGKELKALAKQTLGTRVHAQVALLFDWDNWWAVEYSSGPSIAVKYLEACMDLYASWNRLGFTVDIVAVDADLEGYKVILAPMLKMIKSGVAERLEQKVESGATLVATPFTGIVDETDRAFANGYPGPLAKLFGIWVEETDALAPAETNSIVLDGKPYECGTLCDRITLEGAESVSVYEEDFYAKEPAITLNHRGNGNAYYVGSRLNEGGFDALFHRIAEASGLKSWSPSANGEVEVVQRGSFVFVLNHTKHTRTIHLPKGHFIDQLTGHEHRETLILDRFGVAILSEKVQG